VKIQTVQQSLHLTVQDRFTEEFIKKELKEAFFDNSDNKIIHLEDITFTRDDIEKVKK
jgi:hypothetical protein